MPCPRSRSNATTTRKPARRWGTGGFTCRACAWRFNERTGTAFNDLQYPTDLVILAVLWRLRILRGWLVPEGYWPDGKTWGTGAARPNRLAPADEANKLLASHSWALASVGGHPRSW